jgi:hypothetical protein
MTGDMIRITSLEDKPFKLVLAKKEFNIRPGKDVFIPFELLCKDFGDPRTMTEKFKIPIDGVHAAYINSRHDDISRLSVMYGVYDPNNLDGFDGPDPMDANKVKHFAGIREKMHKIKAFSLEGDEITLPCDDPDCTQSGDYEDVATDAYMARQLAESKARLQMLEQQMAYRMNQASEEVASIEPDTRPSPRPADMESDNVMEDKPIRRPRVQAVE